MANIESLHEGRFLRLVRRGTWEFCQRTGISGVVGIVAVSPEGKLILTQQYRPPVDAQVIELPAGLAGDIAGAEDEAHETSAIRELLEETGYRAAAMRPLCTSPSSAGLTDETITLFLASGLVREHDGGGDEHENIEVHEVPLADVPAWLEQKRQAGCLIDHKIYAGLYFLNQAK